MFEALVMAYIVLALSAIIVTVALEVVGSTRAMREEYNRSLRRRDERIAGAERLKARWLS
jgi:hypothetical protein